MNIGKVESPSTLLEIVNDPAYVEIVLDICIKKHLTWWDKRVIGGGEYVSFYIPTNVTLDDLKTAHWVKSLRHGPYFAEEIGVDDKDEVDDVVIVSSDLLRSISDIDETIDILSRTVCGLTDL